MKAPDAELIRKLTPRFRTRHTPVRDWSADGKSLLVGAPRHGVQQVYRIDGALAPLAGVTAFQGPVGRVRASHGVDPAFLLFSPDKSGREGNQVYRLDLDLRAVTRLTDGKSRHGRFHLSRDGKVLAVPVLQGTGRETAIQVMDPRDPSKARLIARTDGRLLIEDISADGTKILLLHSSSPGEGVLQEASVAGGQVTSLTSAKADQKVAYSSARYAPDGKFILATSDDHGDFRQLVRIDLPDGSETPLTSKIAGNVELVEISPSGTHAAFTSNEDGASKLHLMDLKSGAISPVAGIPTGVLSELRFDPAGRRLALNVSASRHSGDVFVVEVPAGSATRWTQNAEGSGADKAGAEPQLVHFPTFDSVNGRPREVPAWYYPAPPKPGQARAPVVILFHQTPSSQWRPAFNPMIAALTAELGTAVIAPNLRGSGGQGKAYHALDDGTKRSDVLKDVGALLDWIKTQPHLDPERVAVVGVRYGGSLAIAALARYQGRIRAGAALSAILDLSEFEDRSQGETKDRLKNELGDATQPDVKAAMTELSASSAAEKIEAPLMILHGAHDRRVPLKGAEHLYRKLLARKTSPALFVSRPSAEAPDAARENLLTILALCKFLQTRLLAS